MNAEVEAYVAKQSDEVRERLGVLRGMVTEQCPQAVEAMNYGLIGYKLNGHPLIYFGGFKQHVGMYATPVSHEAFATELAAIGVTRMSQLANHSEAELLALHGVGPRAIKLMREAGVSLRQP